MDGVFVLVYYTENFLFGSVYSWLNSARAENLFKIRKTPRSQELAPQGPRKREEEHTHRHTLKAYVEENWTGSG